MPDSTGVCNMLARGKTTLESLARAHLPGRQASHISIRGDGWPHHRAHGDGVNEVGQRVVIICNRQASSKIGLGGNAETETQAAVQALTPAWRLAPHKSPLHSHRQHRLTQHRCVLAILLQSIAIALCSAHSTPPSTDKKNTLVLMLCHSMHTPRKPVKPPLLVDANAQQRHNGAPALCWQLMNCMQSIEQHPCHCRVAAHVPCCCRHHYCACYLRAACTV